MSLSWLFRACRWRLTCAIVRIRGREDNIFVSAAWAEFLISVNVWCPEKSGLNFCQRVALSSDDDNGNNRQKMCGDVVV